MRNFSTGRIALAAGVMAFGGALWQAQAAAPEELEAATATYAGKDVYGIVNLVPSPVLRTYINARGQVALEYIALDDRLHAGVFNGERLLDISPPGHDTSSVSGINDWGEVALQIRFPRTDPSTAVFQPYRWSAARGLVPLPSPNPDTNTFLQTLNNRGEIVGGSDTTGDSNYRAVRWTAANRLLPLPSPTGLTNTFATDINENNITLGDGQSAGGASHLIVWNAAGRATDLGTLGASSVVSRFLNNRGDIVGLFDFTTPNFTSFLLSPGKGAARIGLNTVPTDLNEAGEVVGRVQRSNNENRAFVFSRARGLVNLNPSSFWASEANGLNDSGVVVGLAWPEQYAQSRAWRWLRSGAGVDLNRRLLNAPGGLVLTNALTVSANGDIVAESNAGLVLLRPNGGGTDAPVLGPIQLTQLQVNRPVQLTLSLRDRNPADTHSATVDWGDGRGPQAAALREYRGKGEVRASHTYTAQGDYSIVVRVTDSSRRSTTLYERINLLELGTPGQVAKKRPQAHPQAPGR
ncbi:hypothetical protein LK542_04815 [Massilia sp. IC2-477]|uniref:PKD domain-containing protein n=1 Tax=Massilia sp. IC2-477 TaxID=2887198 RepID=UPI001D1111C7|nr:PKD domain-containing protein [Massilia sp. IC2-477]MCC2954937.1 hypothetical protein [Massilia sp. IC2-477]